ncbi:hypothetical protein P3X46_013043 [Hevea brasiliensis]|uniref:Reverse transcriptase domain-containing protein n=1 Tax=Hevea brasiliensis TaxID=3981 RepID=A0ABQ9M675_HEVBR|nr:hypothetical protein P3X46_013043 [Hevea brasiliensis]
MVNSSPIEEIHIAKRLRQGDTHSPFLFIIAAEGFSYMFRKAKNLNLLSGIPISNHGDCLTRLQYVDDALVLCNGIEFEVVVVKRILHCFALILGLNVNFHKSTLIGINVDSPKCWDPIISCIEKKLATWQCRYLSMGGRLTLVKASLSNLLVYYLSIFKILSSIAKKITAMQGRFFWHGLSNKKKIDHYIWISDEFFNVRFPSLFSISLDQSAMVSRMGIWDGSLWQWCLIWRRPLREWEIDQKNNLLDLIKDVIICPFSKDKMIWKFDTNGNYRVTSATSILSRVQSTQSHEFVVGVWKSIAPLKLLFSNWEGLVFGSLQKVIWMCLFFSTLWPIWLYRNKVIFEGASHDIETLFSIIFHRAYLWLGAFKYDFPFMGQDILLAAEGIKSWKPHSPPHPLLSWLPTFYNYVKWNVDALALRKPVPAGLGGVLRNSLGHYFCIILGPCGIRDSNEAKVLAILKALQLSVAHF